MRTLIGIMTLLFISACSSIPRDEVISRTDDVSEKPSWASLSKPTYCYMDEKSPSWAL